VELDARGVNIRHTAVEKQTETDQTAGFAPSRISRPTPDPDQSSPVIKEKTECPGVYQLPYRLSLVWMVSGWDDQGDASCLLHERL